MSDNRIRELIRNEVRNAVANQVKREMTPDFIEIMCRQFIFQSQLNNAVKSQLPNILEQNNGIISQFVQIHLPSVLCQQHYFQESINQQKELFNNANIKQVTAYQQQQQALIPKLRQETDRLIAESVRNVADSSFMISKLHKTISSDVNSHLQQEINKIQNDINKTKKDVKNGMVLSGMIGAGVACSVIGLIRYFEI